MPHLDAVGQQQQTKKTSGSILLGYEQKSMLHCAEAQVTIMDHAF